MNTLYDLPGEVLRGRKELLRIRKYGSAVDADAQSQGEDWATQQPSRAGDGRKRREKDGLDPARTGIRAVVSL